MGNLKYFSMFSGIGGFELGIQQAWQGIYMQSKAYELSLDADKSSNNSNSSQRAPSCVGYSEIDRYAIKVYERNFNGHTNYGNATTIKAEELPDFDLLVGGFPCQAFSIAGKRKGFDDTRGTLFFDIARIAREKQPMYMLLENVKGLISHDGGKTLEVILENLQDMGYYVNYEVHNSKDYGVPQNRERIYLLCRHAKLLEELGQNKKPIISKQIITEYLFQLLLNNLAEVRKLQETNSKEWVLGYLLSKEINQSLKSSDESIKAGITTLTDGSIFLLKDEELWQNIDTWLSKNLADGSNELSMSTILTAIRRITTSTTYTFSTMQQLIWLAIVALKKSQPNLWQKVLSDLILIKEDTKYARINNKKEEIIVTETGTAHITTNFQDYGERFIVGHLRGECSGEVFPITGKGGNDTRVVGKEVARTIEASYYKGVSPNGHQGAGRQLIHQLNQPTHSNDRVYGTDGLKVSDDIKIRRLTPTECELLQGFPDSWTALGIGDEPISDSQRYKMCGNAVTVNVVEAVMKGLLHHAS
jgi:DNA (cytosine-5)-methyltransferase 1